MVSPRLNPQASWEFEAEILVLHHPTTISPRYQAMGKCQRAASAVCFPVVVVYFSFSLFSPDGSVKLNRSLSSCFYCPSNPLEGQEGGKRLRTVMERNV